jgi:hypothetical protein
LAAGHPRVALPRRLGGDGAEKTWRIPLHLQRGFGPGFESCLDHYGTLAWHGVSCNGRGHRRPSPSDAPHAGGTSTPCVSDDTHASHHFGALVWHGVTRTRTRSCRPQRVMASQAIPSGCLTSTPCCDLPPIPWICKDSGNPTGKHLIFRLILPNSCLIRSNPVTSSQSRFFRLGDALRDRSATPEAGTFVPNSRRHGGAVAICKNC